jgi:DNA helicase-2/ATP-dependent DNA helicase PcrA
MCIVNIATTLSGTWGGGPSTVLRHFVSFGGSGRQRYHPPTPLPRNCYASSVAEKIRRYTLKKPARAQKQYRVRYEDELNQEQLDVVMAGEGPMLVIAGAGSGKTRALTYRVSRLIEDGVDPSDILLVTFTNKAAREMLSRVEQLVTIDTRRIWGGTFHSIGNRLLRQHATTIGYRSSFTILDSEDAKEMMESAISSLGIKTLEKRFPKGDVLIDIY